VGEISYATENELSVMRRGGVGRQLSTMDRFLKVAGMRTCCSADEFASLAADLVSLATRLLLRGRICEQFVNRPILIHPDYTRQRL
jgi:hypothetical protein